MYEAGAKMIWRSTTVLQNPERAALGGIVDPTKVVLCLGASSARAADDDRATVAERRQDLLADAERGIPETAV